MHYREIAPSPELSHLIWSFWEFRVDERAPGPLRHEVFPDGCISIFYFANRRYDFAGIGCSGLIKENWVTEVLPGNLYWGVRVAPAACAQVFDADPARLQRGPEFENPRLTAGILEEMNNCAGIDQAIVIYEDRFESLGIALSQLDSKVVEAVETIEETKGNTKIAEIAEMIGLSTRHLQRSFRRSTGLTPKQFTRARRFRATAVSMVEDAGLNWAQRAAEFGFTDQAHLNHEFSSVTGRSPNSFAEKVGEIDHGDLV